MRASLLPLAAGFLMWAAPGAAQALPDGPGKEILETKCSVCHAPEQATTFGRSVQEWNEVVATMVSLGAEVSDEETKVLVDYLAKNWPAKPATPPGDKPADNPEPKPEEKPSPQAAASAARVALGPTVTIREWDVPTPKSRPHDPLAASDGSIWYTGQMANVLGRIDPSSIRRPGR
ncbi:MAG: hypothetical protein EXQ55_09895 [Acidobacteria bacterium]|nr:hypothetical protein [Acidobacteriota bacterium]